MILHNLNIINDAIKSIKIDGERISRIYSGDDDVVEYDDVHLHFDDNIAFPGLINSHDHLDFNLFPQLGNRYYNNYLEWGPDIHKQDKAIIDTVLNIPKPLRSQWGMYKNLINGVTTVVQHGEQLLLNDSPINVFTKCNSLHSVRLEINWKFKLNNPFASHYPFAIHIGEGTDKASNEEIDSLINWNIFRRKIIGIHGVAMTPVQAAKFEALIWCPESNFFLLNATAPIDQLKEKTKILFGTDSTVSAGWSIWEQMRNARKTMLLTDAELINAVSSLAAEVWGLDNTAQLKENYYADIVITKKKEDRVNDADTFFQNNPEDIFLIMSKGNVIFFDDVLVSQLKHIVISNYSRVFIQNVAKYVIGDLPKLIREIRTYMPEIHLPVEIE